MFESEDLFYTISMLQGQYLDCKHENKGYTCHMCNTGLCHQCALHHVFNLYHNVTYDCMHNEKIYQCSECDRFLCDNCLNNHLHFSDRGCFVNSEKNYFSCRHENKIFRCRTCLLRFCGDCKHKHITDSNKKQHDIILSCFHNQKEYICRTCEMWLCIRCKDIHVENPKLGTHYIVLICSHQNREYHCRTCKGNLCCLCKDSHVVDSNAALHDIVLKCSHQNKEYHCRTCKDNLCCLCKDSHVVDSNAALHDIVLVCKHPDKEYHCKTCDKYLCITCKENHTVDFNAIPHNIVLVARCDHQIKVYHCRGCGTEFCISCALQHMIIYEPNKHELQYICNHENKEYMCKTCGNLLCGNCTDEHVQDFSGKLHNIIFVCRHRNKDFHCRTCLETMCAICRINHALYSDIRSHDIVILCTHPVRKYHCLKCSEDLCVNCREKHVLDLESKSHDIVIKWDDCEEMKTQEICKEHTCSNYEKWCSLCDVPLCQNCIGHEEHNILDILPLYEIARDQQNSVIISIRSEDIPHKMAIQRRLQSALKENTAILGNIEEQHISIKSHNLKIMIDEYTSQKAFTEIKNRILFELKRNAIQRIKRRRIRFLETFEQTYERFTNKPLQFIKFFKRTHFDKILQTSHFTCELNNEAVLDLLYDVHIDKRRHNVYKESLIKMMTKPIVKSFFTVASVSGCDHISCLTSDCIWIKKEEVLVLTDTSGNSIDVQTIPKPVLPLCKYIVDPKAEHAITNTNELLYISSNFNIDRLSADFTRKNTVISKQITSKPLCIYSIPANGDILVGISNYVIKRITGRANITRYNMNGEVKETIVHDNDGNGLYDEPHCISVNNNGDVIVSDRGRNAVIVVEGERRHRFTYTGHPPESGLSPYGICTDAMSHILLCDGKTNTIHIIDSDGVFVSYLRSKLSELCKPYTLAFDMKTNFLLIGEKDRDIVFFYKYLTSTND